MAEKRFPIPARQLRRSKELADVIIQKRRELDEAWNNHLNDVAAWALPEDADETLFGNAPEVRLDIDFTTSELVAHFAVRPKRKAAKKKKKA